MNALERGRASLLACGMVVLCRPVPIHARQHQPTPPVARQSLDDAWWTGPMMANSAGTLPRGHFLFEPYVYDVMSAHAHGFGSRAYLLYGLVNRLTVGVIPIVGFNKVSGGPSSSGVGLGDFTPMAQFRLTQFHAGRRLPTMAVELQETLPTGKYDRLGDRPSDGFGGGAYTTTVSLNTQTYFWLPNGRILRMRLDLSRGFSGEVSVRDVSVYGTEAGFRGRARPGGAFFGDASWEYSVTRSWVLALDVIYGHNGNTRVTGYSILDPAVGPDSPGIRLDSGTSDAFGMAPAIEYSWKPGLGALLGVRVIPAGHNTAHSITPAVAINIVH